MKRLIIILTILAATTTGIWAGGLYQEQTAVTEITTYRRAGNINIDNTYGRTPAITFTSEQITLIPGQKPVTEFLRRTTLSMSDPKEIIPLRHPETGEIIGQTTAEQVYLLVYSLYIHAEGKADAPAMRGTQGIIK